MKAWYLSLSVLEYVYFYVAMIATLLLLVQVVMMAFSFGSDFDMDGDVDVDVDTGVSIFTTKSLTAFFAVGAWVGLLVDQLLPKYPFISVICAFVCGTLAMLFVVLMIKQILKLQCSGNIEPEKLVGKLANVYVSIPPRREGRGKITLDVQGQFTELDAITDEEERLPVDSVVEIIKTENELTIVKRV